MLKVVTEDQGAFYQHYPRVASVVTVNNGGRKNAMAVAWHCCVSFEPPLYGISVSPKRYTYSMILESKAFAINFLPYEKIDVIAAMGSTSGSVMDKFAEFDLAEDQPLKIDAPVLGDAYAAYECAVIENKILGDHAWIIGKVLAVHVAQELLKDDGVLNLDLVSPALYMGGDIYCSTDSTTVRYIDREKFRRH